MKKDISEDEWDLLLAIRNARLAGYRSPFELRQYARDLFEILLLGDQ